MLDAIYHAIDPVIFTIGPFAVRWYGLAYVLGFLCAAILLYKVAKRWRLGIDFDTVLTIVICLMLGIIIGARVGYCFIYGEGYYFTHPLAIFALTEGGMSFHGGLVGALIGGFVATRITKIAFLTLADLVAIGAPIGLFLGRCANFINGELWGAVTDLPWGVVFGGAAGNLPRHPSQLYEALLEGLVIFIVLYALSRKLPPRPRGTFFGVFLVLYGIARILVEFVRQPDAQIGYLAGDWLTMGMLLSVPVVLAGIVLLIVVYKKQLPQIGTPNQIPFK